MRPFALLLVLLFLASFSPCISQTDSASKNSILVKADTVLGKKKNRKEKNPRRASLLSAIVPGAGQLYNGKYWKLPILYGGGFALGYYIHLNHGEYLKTRDSYLQVQAGKKDQFNGLYDAEQLVRLREYWRRNRDLLIIISSFTYLLNIADAAVDAHLSSFDVSDDLTFEWQPMYFYAGGHPVVGMQMALRF
jgi:hypothetical protein